MDDATWEATVERLRDQGLSHLVTVIPRACWETADRDEEHPLYSVLRRRNLRGPAAHARETDRALGRVDAWLKAGKADLWGGWWEGKLHMLQVSPMHAAGVLAEVRAFGAMLSTSGNVLHEEVDPHTDSGRKAPDFRIGKRSVYIEVCTARMNEHEGVRQKQVAAVQGELCEKAWAAAKANSNARGDACRVHASSRIETTIGPSATRLETVEATAVAVPDEGGGHAMTLTMTRKGPTKPGQTVAKALRGKKPPGQVPEGSAGILWMDLCQPPWALQCRDADSARVFWKGMNLASTLGVWHSFYGRKSITPMVARAYVGFFDPVPAQKRLEFDGSFRSRFSGG